MESQFYQLFITRIERGFNLTFDIYESINSDDLTKDIPNLPSNSFGNQVWCVIGARESYLSAIENGSWTGFSCSLKHPHKREDVLSHLKNSAENFLKYIKHISINSTQMELLLDLHEHEIQHHGQLIRYFYANKLTFPESWKERYTV